jgi:DNA-directed RNA polymerase omega subunit
MATTQKSLDTELEVNPEAPKVDSIYRLIILASQRSKQLVRGSKPRIDADPLKRKNTSIALEEVRRGLVNFKVTDKFGDRLARINGMKK